MRTIKTLQNFILFAILYCSLQSNQVIAETPYFTISEQMNGIKLGEWTKLIDNQTEKQNIADILSRFRAGEGTISRVKTPNFGYSPFKYHYGMIKFFNPHSKAQEFILDVDFGLTDYFSIYKISENKALFIGESGDAIAFESRSFKARTLNHKISLDPGYTEILVSIMSSGNSQLPLKAWTEQSFQERTQSEAMFIGILQGFHLVVIGYTFFLWISLRDQTFIYYIGFVATNLIFHLINFGSAQQLSSALLDLRTCPNEVLTITVDLLVISACLFTASFLSTKTNTPRLHKVLIATIYVCALNATISAFLLPKLAALINIVAPAIVIPTCIVASSVALSKGYVPAKYYMISWFPYIVGATAQTLSMSNLIEASLFTRWSHFIGGAIEAVLFSLALGAKVTYERRLASKEIARLNRRLEGSVKTLKKIASGVAHEVNNPLAILMASLDLIQGHHGDKTKINMVDHAGSVANRAMARISKVTKDLLIFSQDKKIDEKNPINIEIILDQAINAVSSRFSDIAVKTRVDMWTEIEPRILAHPLSLVEAFISLLNLAINRANIEAKPYVSVELTKQDDVFIEIKISDNGAFMSKKEIEDIFDPFLEDNESLISLDLGLSNARSIIILHDGSIDHRYSENMSTFTIRLPLVKEIKNFTTKAS